MSSPPSEGPLPPIPTSAPIPGCAASSRTSMPPPKATASSLLPLRTEQVISMYCYAGHCCCGNDLHTSDHTRRSEERRVGKECRTRESTYRSRETGDE